MKRVLVIGRHEEVLARVLAALARAGYAPLGHLHDADALASMAEPGAHFDALLLGGGVESASRPNLVDAFLRHHPKGRVVEHFGGPLGLLEALAHALGAPEAPPAS
jgi:hypothetical protein